MDEFQVKRWKRFGQDRLYVNFPGGRNAACFDLLTGKLDITADGVDRDTVLSVLSPHLSTMPAPSTMPAATAFPTAATSPAMSPPPAARGSRRGHPARPDDLAVNQPGAAIEALLAEREPGFWRALVDRLLRRERPETEGWRTGLAGERIVAAELAPLESRGWRVLHSIPLANEVDIDHLLIGPGGVFSINTKHHHGSRIWVGDDAVRLGPRAYQYVRKARAEAQRASTALSRACGFDICVAGVLAFVNAEQLTVVETLKDVYAVHHDDLGTAFDVLRPVWGPADVERIYACARVPATWVGV
ncbi:nuclease-related domain-containing protein [Parafrankia sp. FMc2]|uniref:nuclease-related domain-containing protein n=1 Tax=Parafrankia sp. FMc2 TaxID=3233196 RepID=UPI0034D6B90D